MAKGNDGRIDLNKTDFGGYGKGLSESPFGNMELGFHKKELGFGLETGFDLPKELGTVRYFVEHIAGKRKISGGVDADIVRGTSIGTNAVSKVSSGGSLHHNIESLLLEVYGYDGACFAYQVCHGDGEVSHATAKVEKGHSRGYVRVQNRLRRVEQAAKTVVECIGKPPRTNAAAAPIFLDTDLR